MMRHWGKGSKPNSSPAYEDDNEYEEEESISVYDAADIWFSNGKDEDYMFGYTAEELEEAYYS